MASFTSNATGNWNAAATWTHGTDYPGEQQADSVTILTGHNVTLNIATFPFSITTITVNSGGTLTIAANMTTAGEITGAVSVSGTLIFSTGATYAFLVDNNVTINSGGYLTMDASGASSKQTIAIECGSDDQYGITLASGSHINLDGRNKTVRTQLNGALTTGSTSMTVDDDTGWEANDYVLLAPTGGVAEGETLQITGSSPSWTIPNPSNAHADNGTVINLTRSCVLTANNASYACTLTQSYNAGGPDIDMDYVEIYHAQYLNLWGVFADPSVTWTGLAIWGVEVNDYGIEFQIYDISITLAQCAIWCGNNAGTYCVFIQAPVTQPTFQNCYMGGAASNVFLQYGPGPLFDGGEIFGGPSGADGIVLNYSGCRVHDHNIYALDTGILATGGDFASRVIARNVQFGQDPGGNSIANTTDVDMGSAAASTFQADDCLFTASTELTWTGASHGVRMARSYNHDQATGILREWHRAGVIDTISGADARGGSGKAWRLDPSSAVKPLELRFKFTVDNADTPTLTFYAKGSGTLGTLSARIGDQDAGVGSVATGSPFTVTGSYVQKTVTFTSAADRDGDVEVIVEVFDSASGLLYIDDIDVAVP